MMGHHILRAILDAVARLTFALKRNRLAAIGAESGFDLLSDPRLDAHQSGLELLKLLRALVQISSAAEKGRRLRRAFHAFSTVSQIAGAAWPLTRRRPSANWPFRMRLSNSIPAIVIAAFSKTLKPSIGPVRDFTPR